MSDWTEDGLWNSDYKPWSREQLNIPLLRKGVEWVEAQAELDEKTRSWHQGAYVVSEEFRVAIGHEHGCGTAYCLAGYIGQLADPRFQKKAWINVGEDDELHVSDAAERALGLPIGHDLWAGSNTAQNIREIAEDIAGEKL